MQQPTYPAGSHDSLQYHFFCEDKLFAARIFRTDTLEHHSAWVFDGTARAILASEARIIQSGASYLDVSAKTLQMRSDDAKGRLVVKATDEADSFEVDFTLGKTFSWSDTLNVVIHQPTLECVGRFKGREYSGRGYCKRYNWQEPPHYWGYRFLQGFVDGGSTAIWTADAVFGENKYDYFKVLAANGNLLEIDSNSCAHKQNSMFGYVDGIRHQAEFEELGVWNQILKSKGMDSHLQQRYGRVRYFDGKTYRQGIAMTEYCFGTLG
jgi:hypothetical protein